MKSIQEIIGSIKDTKTKTKANKTLSLTEVRYDKFRAYCKTQGLTASEVVDALILWLLEEVE